MRTTLGHAIAMLVALAMTIHAQRIETGLSVVAGSATDVVGVTSRAVTVAPSLSLRPDPHVALGLEGAGTRFGEGQWSLAGGVTSSARIDVNRLASLAIDAAGALTSTSYKVAYRTGTAMPSLQIATGPVTSYIGARGALARTSAEQTTTSGVGGLLGGDPTTETRTLHASRSSRAIVYGANARVARSANEAMYIGLREERGTIDTMPTIDRIASLSVARGRLTIGGNVGLRSERTTRSTFGTGTLSVAVTPAAAIELNAGAYPANRLVGTSSGRFLTLGVSLRAARSSSAAPIAEGAPSAAAGFTRLTLRDENAARVEVLGDFTRWKPIAAARANNGVWYVDLRIPPGEYRYAFRVNGTVWRVPDGAVAIDDDFGGKSARLVVAAPSSSPR